MSDRALVNDNSAKSDGQSTLSLLSDNDASSSKPFEKSTSLSVLSPTTRRSNDLSELKVDKLRLDSIGLHGRDDEVSALLHAFDSLASESGTDRHLCLISGPSGAGKTKLAETLKEAVSRNKGLFVKGKFDLNLRNQPYSGISNACAQICGAVLELKQRDPTRAKEITDEVEASLDNELKLLVQTIPILAEIVNLSNIANDDSLSEVSLSTNDAKNRVNFAFVRFFRVMAYQFFPLAFVLDDLQWGDASSFDLLEVLMADHQVHKFMLIGIYRSNEVDETHLFHHCLQELEAKSQMNAFGMTKLQIHDLDLPAVNMIIQDSLQCDDSRTLGLAEVCFKKTHGNPFYVIHYLSNLYENQLLQYNFGILTWMWNNEEIELVTRASDNVVDLLRNRMMELPDHILDILKIAACLGSTFERRLLHLVWSRIFSTPDENFNFGFVFGIGELMKEEILVKLSETPPRIGWVHDKIHEAAIALVSPEDRQGYHRRVGEILASELEEDELDSAIFVVVDLLKGSLTSACDDEARLKLSRLNLKASQKAVRLSAFESAAKYAGEGIALLRDKDWEDHYDLCLQLYSLGAKAESYVGNVITMDKYCQAVLSQEHKPLEDKFDVYNTLIDNTANQCKVKEAANMLLDILAKFNCRFPTNPALIGFGVLFNVMKIKATMKSRNTSDLPFMQDAVRVNLMQLLDKLITCLYMLEDDRLPLVIFRTLNWTMKYGNCASSAPGFALAGMILTGTLGDLQGGSTYGQHALTLLKNMQTMTTAARTMFCVYSFLFPWTQQARSTLKPLLQAYDIGLRTGQTESAAFAIYHCLAIRYYIGSPLESLEADVSLYLKQMIDLKRGQAVKLIKCLYQAILNIMGGQHSNDPIHFAGKGLSEDDYIMAQKDSYWMASLYTYQGTVLPYFGEHLRNADTLLQLGHNYLEKKHPGSPNNMVDMYLKGVSCYAAARQTGKRKYAKLANKCRSKIKKWLDLGSPNVKHYDTFLDAEETALKGKRFAAIKHYEVTILQAARSGYQQDAALASERLGEYQLLVMKDYDEGAFRLREAEKYWRSWGALAKVQHLVSKYPEVFCAIPTEEIFTHKITPRSDGIDCILE